MTEGLAIVYSESEDTSFTSIGLSCLTSDMPIITNKGLKEIKDVKIGDKVLSKTGNFNKVLNVIPSKRKENLREINFFGSNIPLRISLAAFSPLNNSTKTINSVSGNFFTLVFVASFIISHL